MFQRASILLLENGSLFRRLALNQTQKQCKNRNFSSTYEHDGKSMVKVLNNDRDLGLMINSFSEVSSPIKFINNFCFY